jgi:hypothetical protein
MVILEGRLKSPSIDESSWSKSIGGDFNRPSDVTTMSKPQLCNLVTFQSYNRVPNCQNHIRDFSPTFDDDLYAHTATIGQSISIWCEQPFGAKKH